MAYFCDDCGREHTNMSGFENSRYFKIMGSPIALAVGLVLLVGMLIVVVRQS